MANTNNPFGFELFKSEGKENRVREYIKTTSGALYPGDCVTLISAGTVSVAAANDVVLGVVATYAADATTSVLVYDDPEAEFIVQCDPEFALADIGLNCQLVATAGDSSRKQSNHSVDSLATTNTHQFKILGLADKGANAVGSYAIVRVKPNTHKFNFSVVSV